MTAGSLASIRTILNRNKLSRIELLMTDRGVTAKAVPHQFHPVVEVRRREALQAKASWDVREVEEINSRSLSQPVAEAKGEFVEEALIALLGALRLVNHHG